MSEFPIGSGERWTIFVPGTPRPQGSKTAHAIYRKGPLGPEPVLRDGRVLTTMSESSKGLAGWRREISETAQRAWAPRGAAVLDEPVILILRFYVRRLASDFRKDGSLRDSAPLYPHTSGADLDKLARAIFDSLTGIVFRDDRRVVTAPLRRRFGPQPGVAISVRRFHATTMGQLRAMRDTESIRAQAIADQLALDLFS